MDENKTKSPKIINCKNCNSEVPEGTKFCVECGSQIEEELRTEKESENICPNCNYKLKQPSKFCPECGNPIDESTNKITTCPQCDVELEPGTKFCPECGTNISTGESKSEKTNEESNWIKSVSKSGKGILKEVDTIISSAASNLENSSSKKEQKLVKPKRIKGVEHANPGFLVCNSCGGYYPLKSCENPDDFSYECECGGEFKHIKKLPTPRRIQR